MTHHRLSLDGRTFAYTARAGTITLRNGSDEPIVRVFYTAYTLDGADPSRRAVTFLYNGGPGSSTMWLRMGSFGPVRVVTGDGTLTGPPPYRLVDNQYSLLDKTDLVFIDMPGSGFGRIIGAGDRKDLWGVDQDAAAFGQFIERYITNFNRWNSPRFLFGESYGTMRSAVLAKYLQDKGIGLNGVVLLSSFLNANIDYNDGSPVGGGDWAYILYLPTEAATAWYHHAFPHPPASRTSWWPRSRISRSTNTSTRSVKARSSHPTVITTSSPSCTSTPASRAITFGARTCAYPTIASRTSCCASAALPSGESTRASRRTCSTGPRSRPIGTHSMPRSTRRSRRRSTTTFGRCSRYNTPLLYRGEIYDLIYADGESWDFKHGQNVQTLNVTPDLAQAMSYNPNLKIFSANGYFDFATPFFATVYALNHLYLAPSLQRNISYGFYDCGHMVYLHPESLAHFHADLERWYARVLPHA